LTHVAVLPGDGIGPEVTAVARRVLEAAGLEATWSEHPVGWSEWCRVGEPLPAATLDACRAADAILFGAITSKPDDEAQRALPAALRGTSYRSPILRLRHELVLWANVRPVRGNGLDLVIFRENTEGLYAGLETDGAALQGVFPGLAADAAVSLRVVTPAATRRIFEAAFRHAEAEGRLRVTLVEKANVLRRSGGLVRRIFYEVAADFPDLEADDLHIDAACALLVRDPSRFDVVVATNLFGDILSDLAAELSGGLATAASANLGDHRALFEPVHGSAPDIAGTGVADPRGAVAAAAMLARHVGQADVAVRIEQALAASPACTTTVAWEAALVD
jgi:isocitrate/isopropylmalate dehydrogenase